jgi:hypothetical protein
MTNPLVPNFRVDSGGRLVTDRFDFQNHVDGYNFRHHADQIDLFPTLVINSVTTTNVQAAITSLSALILPPVIPDATTSVKGILKLAGDFATSSTALVPVVGGIQGKPISTLAPSSGDVLTFTAGVWGPSPAINAFVANGDLAGTNVLQSVIGLTGAAGIVTASCDTVRFIISIANPTITQIVNTAAAGNNLSILAQPSSFGGAAGGNVVLGGGAAGAGGTKGGVTLKVSTDNLLQVTEVAPGRRVLSLFKTTNLDATDMPVGTGDMVMYLRDAVTPPFLGSPTNGSIIYSSGGQVYIAEASGNNFVIGSIPNPSTWGVLALGNGQTISLRGDGYTTTTSPALVWSATLTDNATTRIDALIIGKEVGTNQSAQFNLSMGYVRNGGGAPVAIGTVTNADPRATAPGATGWTIPDIALSGNVAQVKTGYNAATNIYWTAITQVTICRSA